MNNIFPIIIYNDIMEYKDKIYNDNRNKSGIYRWTNKINGKSYIGSSINLRRRLSEYFNAERLRTNLLRSKSMISKSLLKYGFNNFNLEILEYCEEESLLRKREQYYIDLLKPKYNINKNTTSGFLGRKHTLETVEILRLKSTGRKHSIETKRNLGLQSGKLVLVTNIKNSLKIEYSSAFEAAKNLNVCVKTIHNYTNTKKILKDTFLIEKSTKIKKVHNSIPITIINTITGEIYNYSSIKEVANKFHVSDSVIRYYIKNNIKYQNIYRIKQTFLD